MPKGQIVKAISGFYYVESDNQIWECRARGIFKQRNQSPLVGDYVIFDKDDNSIGYVTEIEPRNNELVRPPVCNIDQVVTVASAIKPKFSSHLLDRFLVHVESAEIKPIICLTKVDLLVDKSLIKEKLNVYENLGYKILMTSKFGEGIEELRELLKDKVSVFSGQSGVGKSSLLNKLLPDLKLETAEISDKLGRGKHTTRVVQLINIPSGGKVADTPGFSQLDFHGIDSQELANYFPEINEYSSNCRFRGCLHKNEPNCAVKEAVENKKIDINRYKHYLEFLDEIKEVEANKWR